MQGKDFLFFLFDDQKRSYYRDEYGTVQISTLPKPLKVSPDAWRDISLQVERNRKYFGLDRSFTIPLKYVEDSAAIVKYHYYTYGVMAKLNLVIAEQKLFIDDTTYGYYYDTLYTGQVDFSTFNHSGAVVTCNTIEGGLSKYLKANENTVYPIDIDVPEAVNIYNDGLNLKASSNYLSITQSSTVFNTAAYAYTWLQLAFITNEGTIFDTTQESTLALTIWRSNADNDDNRYLDNYFFSDESTQNPITINIKFDIDVTLYNSQYTRLYIKNSNGSRIDLFQFNGNASPTGQTIKQTFHIDQNITIAAGEKLYLISKTLRTLVLPSGVAEFGESQIFIIYTSRYKPTLTKSLPAEYVLQQIVKKMSGDRCTASSLLLRNSSIMLSCGDAIRGLAGSQIKTSFSQFFNSLNVRLNIGVGIENGVLILEEKGRWFDDTNDIFLGEVDEWNTEADSEDLYNTVRVGWNNQDYESFNGRDEFNTTFLFTTDVDVVSKEFTLIGDYRTDMYGAELTRINLDGKKTTDSSTDNDTWMFKVNGIIDGNYILDRSFNSTATGLIDPASAYNIYFSPKRCLNAHGWYIRSFLDKLDNTYLKFQTADKNAELVSDGIVEKADVLIGDLEARKFLPVLFNIGIAPPDNLDELLSITPIRSYTFNIHGIKYKGLPLEVGTEPATNKRQVYQLLADPSCDLKLLTDIYE